MTDLRSSSYSYTQSDRIFYFLAIFLKIFTFRSLTVLILFLTLCSAPWITAPRLDALAAKLPDQELMWHQVWCVELDAVDVGVELWQLALLFGLRTHQHQLC